MGLLLTGRHLSAARAHEIGPVNKVVPAADLDAAVDAWVADILACSPVAVRATKQSALVALHLSLAGRQPARRPVEVPPSDERRCRRGATGLRRAA